MGIDRSGVPFIGAAGVPAVLAALAGYRMLALPFLVLGLFFLYFFRDPDRDACPGPDDLLSPADGRVLVAGPAESAAPAGVWQQVSIFLSPLDVHVNRVPIGGRIARVAVHSGPLPARLPARGRDQQRAQRDAGSIAAARSWSAARSSECSPAASSAGSARGRW